MPLSAGTRLGPYQILSPLGAGGMGEVYRARDPRMGRDVAIKLSAEHFSDRFDREVRAVAALNHANVCQIYDVGPNYLVMELIEGPTLSERIKSGGIPFDEALSIARQIGEALDAAHQASIIHRDLKPANIKIKSDGAVKVLDFGLAKINEPSNVAGNPEESPTIPMGATIAGQIMGTAAYMAPEQARGKPVDKRADIWAFGVVLYEMLSGRRLFEGETISDTLAAVLTQEPEWDRVPGKAHRLLRRCLEKDPKRRLRDIADAWELLADTPPPAPARSSRAWIVAAAALLVAGTLLWRQTRPAVHPLTRLNVDLGPDVLTGTSSTVAISPDGRRLVYPVRSADGKQLLATRLLDQTQPTVLTGTENGYDPFLSPDGQWVGFFADGKMKKISVHGGGPVELCPSVNPRGASWGNDGNIVVALNLSGPLSRVPDTGGPARAITRLSPNEASHRWPQVLPGGEAIVFTASPHTIGHEDANVAVFSLKTGRTKMLQRGGYFGRVLPSGHLLYVHRGVLLGVGFDIRRLELRGAPMPLIEDVAANPLTGGGQVDFSGAAAGPGTLVYVAGKAAAQTWQLAWLDASGHTRPLIATPGAYAIPRFSPDGRKLVFIGSDSIPHIYDLERETTTRVTSVGSGGSVAWAPDGKHVVFGIGGVVSWIRSDGAGGLQRLVEGVHSLSAWSFSPDGRWLAYFETMPETGADLWTLPLDMADPDHPKPGTPQVFLRTQANELLPKFSPDGRWIAYRSDETGGNEIWVMPFPAGTGARWQISAGGGLYAVWSNNGRQLFYETADYRIMVVDYRVDGDSFVPGKPRLWSDRQLFYPGVSNMDLAPDGQRFAVLVPSDAGSGGKGSTRVTLLLNYFDELRRKIP